MRGGRCSPRLVLLPAGLTETPPDTGSSGCARSEKRKSNFLVSVWRCNSISSPSQCFQWPTWLSLPASVSLPAQQSVWPGLAGLGPAVREPGHGAFPGRGLEHCGRSMARQRRMSVCCSSAADSPAQGWEGCQDRPAVLRLRACRCPAAPSALPAMLSHLPSEGDRDGTCHSGDSSQLPCWATAPWKLCES